MHSKEAESMDYVNLPEEIDLNNDFHDDICDLHEYVCLYISLVLCYFIVIVIFIS